jgi:hypothetical protein
MPAGGGIGWPTPPPHRGDEDAANIAASPVSTIVSLGAVCLALARLLLNLALRQMGKR